MEEQKTKQARRISSMCDSLSYAIDDYLEMDDEKKNADYTKLNACRDALNNLSQMMYNSTDISREVVKSFATDRNPVGVDNGNRIEFQDGRTYVKVPFSGLYRKVKVYTM